MSHAPSVVSTCPFDPTELFSLWRAFQSRAHSDQRHLLHGTALYRHPKTGEHAFVLVHALLDEGEVEIFDCNFEQAANDLLPSQFLTVDGDDLNRHITIVRKGVEDADEDPDIFATYCGWVAQLAPSRRSMVERQRRQHAKHWDA